MRKAGHVLLAFFVLMLLPAASKDETRAVLKNFGILGAWAVDCANDTHTHFIFDMSSTGTPTLKAMFSSRRINSEILLNAKKIRENMLRLDIQAGEDPTATSIVVLQKLGDTIRFFHRTNAEGTPIAVDGVHLATKLETPALHRC